MLELGIKIFSGISRCVYFFLKMFPTQEKITFISRQSNEPSIDIALLSAELKEQLPGIKIIVKCKTLGSSLGTSISYLPSMIAQMFNIATSKLVILDSYCMPISMLKHKRDLKVLQMWHALGLMKKAGYASIGSAEGRSEKLAKLLHMHRGYTHILASSPKCVSAMLEVFGYSENTRPENKPVLQDVIIRALPRVDYLVDNLVQADMRKRIYEKYPALQGKKVLLYAPTSRKDNAVLHTRIEELIQAVIQANHQGENYALVIKLHPLQADSLTAMQNAYDESIVFDSAFLTVDIGMIAEACISDYSSVIYEFIALDKPVYFFAFDLEEYESNRGLFIDYRKEVPGVIYQEPEELMHAILSSEYSFAEQQDFLAEYVSLNKGNNTKSLAQDIIRIITKTS